MTTLTHRGLRTVSCFQRACTPSISSFRTPLLALQNQQLLCQYRYASTSSTDTKEPSKEVTRSSLNGPLSTHPAPLNLPTRAEYPSTFKYLFNLGKTFATFYKTGVKNIYHNYQSTRPLQSRIDAAHPPTRTDPNVALSTFVSNGQLTRQDFQLLTRSWHDIKRIPAFGLVFLICGEFTPLIVIAISNIVPWTCRIPRQINKDREVLEKRRRISFRNLTLPPPETKGVEGLQRMQLIHISWSLGLSSSVWDYLGGQFPGLPTFMLKKKVARRVQYLEMDDMLLQKGNVEELDEQEVTMACVERGINVVGRNEEDLKEDLGSWLKARVKGAPIERLLLTRPNAWSHAPKSDKPSQKGKI